MEWRWGLGAAGAALSGCGRTDPQEAQKRASRANFSPHCRQNREDAEVEAEDAGATGRAAAAAAAALAMTPPSDPRWGLSEHFCWDGWFLWWLWPWWLLPLWWALFLIHLGRKGIILPAGCSTWKAAVYKQLLFFYEEILLQFTIVGLLWNNGFRHIGVGFVGAVRFGGVFVDAVGIR